MEQQPARGLRAWAVRHFWSSLCEDPRVDDDKITIISEGLAARAQTIFEMGGQSEDVRASLIEQWILHGKPPGIFLAAAEAMTSLPQPLIESAAETERALPIRALFEIPSAELSLVAALKGREVLQKLADEFG